jgi:hypothetical protein
MTDETPNTLGRRRGTQEEFFGLINTMEECYLKRQNEERRIVMQRVTETLCVNIRVVKPT